MKARLVRTQEVILGQMKIHRIKNQLFQDFLKNWQKRDGRIVFFYIFFILFMNWNDICTHPNFMKYPLGETIAKY